MNPSTYDRIRERAYQLWELDGSKHGEDWRYWLEAEREVAGNNGHDAALPADSPVPVKTAAPAKKAVVAQSAEAATTAPAKKASPRKSPSSSSASKEAAPKKTTRAKAVPTKG